MSTALDYYQILKAKGNEEEAFANMIIHRTQCRDSWLNAAFDWDALEHAAHQIGGDALDMIKARANASECRARAAEYEL